ncbi:hypothetical protein BH11MYX3_BH11MYX3_11900 [soil metagenome]
MSLYHRRVSSLLLAALLLPLIAWDVPSALAGG